MNKYWVLSICILLSTVNTIAQKTASFNDEAQGYKTGLELLQQKKYGAALKQFNEFINACDYNKSQDDNHEYYIDALYYRAQCANELDQPQAEKYFLDLVANYEATPVTRMASYYLGNIYYKQKKYDKGIEYFTQITISDLSQDQTNEYRFQLGYCYFMKKKFDKAEALFNVIKEVKNKYYFPSNYYYGYIAYTQGNYEEAMKSFDRIKDSKLYGPIIPYYTASIAYIQEKYNDAISLANTALTNDKLKYREELNQLIGKSYFKLKQYEKALPYLKEYYDKVNKANKNDIYEIAYCQYIQKQYEVAVKSFTQLNTLKDSLGQNALYFLGDCYIKLNQKNNARNAFLQCMKLNFDKKLKEDAAFQYSKLTYDLGYNDQAAIATQDFIKNYPQSKNINDAKELLTNIFLNTNNYRDAVTIIQSIENKTPSIKEAYQKVAYGRAIQLYNEKNYTDALKMFEISLNNPIDLKIQGLTYYWKGECFYAQKKYTEANLNYFKFVEACKLLKNIPLTTSVVSGNYGIGYCYLQKEEYTKALGYFDKCVTQLEKTTKETKEEKTYFDNVYPDALVRLGDCYFTAQNYSKSSEAYSKVISKKLNGADYALLQRGMLNGLTGNINAKIKDLQSLTNTYGTSIYLDDALFETGDTYLKNEQYESAILVFNQIINDYPSSRYVKNSHLKLGLIYFNTNRMVNALEEYKIVASKYPNTIESKTAIEGVKEIYVAQGDADGVIKWLKALPNGGGVTASQEDSIVYAAVERQFTSENYDAALDKLSDYINSFPNGVFITDARYYRASCLLRNNDYSNALTDFVFVINRNDSKYLENSLLFSARIEFYNKYNYEEALKYYNLLSKQADTKSNKYEAKIGIMKSAFELKKYSEARVAANDIINDMSSKEEDKDEANYILGKCSLSEKKYNEAITSFQKVEKNTQSEYNAESSYLIAESYFNNRDLDKAEKQALKVINGSPNSDYWLMKSYIIISDIFKEQNDLFNAKATLQSVIDNYTGKDDIIPLAKSKLTIILELENNESKMMDDKMSQDLQEDEPLLNDSTSAPLQKQ
jgi:TolA-binding protein